MSVEKSSDFSTNFYHFRGVFAYFEQAKDIGSKTIINKVLNFGEKRTTLFIVDSTKKLHKKYQLTGLECIFLCIIILWHIHIKEV